MTLRHRFAAAGLAAALTLTPVVGLTTSYLAAPSAQAAPSASQSAANAASWLGGQLTNGEYYKSPTTGKADISNTANVLIGLVAGGNNTAATKVDGWLRKNVSGATSAGQLASIAIAAEAMNEDPAAYGGHDLISEITSAVDKGKGSLGDPFSDSLAIIALKGASDQVPDDLVTALLKQQNAQGEFFFGSGSSAWPDPDTTGLAIQALDGVEGEDASSALTKAVDWATSNEKSTGYWDSYSPVNTTGLIGSALKEQGKDVSRSVAWMIGQQLKDGGLPASLNGTSSDVLAAAQGILLLAGVTLNSVALQASNLPTPSLPTASLPSASLPSVSLPTASLPKVTLPSSTRTTSIPAISSTGAPTALPATGAQGGSNRAGDLGVLALGVVAVGAVGGAAVLRTRRNS